jgi:hypothetical protein
MSQSEVIDIAVSESEAMSVSETAAKIISETKAFGDKWNAKLSFDPKDVEEDFIIFLTKRKQTNLTKLRVTILEDGGIAVGDSIKGKRKADLIFRITYKPKGGARRP